MIVLPKKKHEKGGKERRKRPQPQMRDEGNANNGCVVMFICGVAVDLN